MWLQLYRNRQLAILRLVPCSLLVLFSRGCRRRRLCNPNLVRTRCNRRLSGRQVSSACRNQGLTPSRLLACLRCGPWTLCYRRSRAFLFGRAPRAFKRHVSGAVPATNCRVRFRRFSRLALGVGSMNVADPVRGSRRRQRPADPLAPRKPDHLKRRPCRCGGTGVHCVRRYTEAGLTRCSAEPVESGCGLTLGDGQYHDLGADLDAVVEVDHVLVDHPDASGCRAAADG